MPENELKLKFKIKLAAPIEEVFSALTNASALSEWLCSVAITDAQKGGRIYLWWESGYYVNGEYINLIPGDRVIFSWHGKGEPGASRVKIVLSSDGPNTLLRLSHLFRGESASWEKTRKMVKRVWRLGLDNLKSVLETGEDLRFSNRPMLGFTSMKPMSAEDAALSGLPPYPGLLILGVIDGMCAQKAGLQAGDYLVRFSGHEVSTLAEINNLLDRHLAGDKIKMVIYRDGQKNAVRGELSRRPMPEIPDDPEELSIAVSRMYGKLDEELEMTLEGVDESWIDSGSSENTWSIRETLGHLIINERELHGLITRLIEGQAIDYTLLSNQPERVRATISAFPDIEGLLVELKQSQAETVALVAELPSNFMDHRRSYWRLALELLQNPPLHYQEHLVLIEHIIQNARRVGPGQFET
jgi:uncharacterized protein YndB with AHSA1/START domain